MARSDIFDILLNMNIETEDAKKEAKQLTSNLANIFQKVTKIELELNDKDIKKNIEKLQGAFNSVGATIDTVFDFSGAQEQLKQLTVNLKNFQNEATKTTISFNGTDAYGNLLMSTSDTKTTSISAREQARDVENLTKLIIEENDAQRKLNEAQQSGNSTVVDYSKAVYDLASKERDLAQISFEQKYGDIGEFPDLWQKIADKADIALKKISADDSIKQKENEVKQFKEALDALSQSQQKMGSLLGSGKEDTEEFSLALTQWTAAKKKLEDYGATVTDTGVKITENSKIVKENRGAFNELDQAAKETTVDMIQAYAKLGDTATFDAQKRAVNDFEKALDKLVSTRQKMYQLEGQGKTDTKEYQVLTEQYNEAKKKLEDYGATVTDTNVKLKENSNVVGNNAETQEKLDNKLDDVNDKLQIYKAKAEDAAAASQNAGEKQNTFSKSIQDSVENFIKYQVAMEAINKITSEFTSAIYDMNEAMAQVRMVTMGSYDDTVQLADSYTQLAKQLGTTTTEVAKGADTWFKMSGPSKIPLIAGTSCNRTISNQAFEGSSTIM